MGGVASHDFTSLSDLWGPLAFHAITTGLGTGLIGRALAARHAPIAPAI